jgi:serine/threonine protein kinase
MNAERWQQIDDIFHEAAGRDPAEQPAYLEHACGEDEELRAEVETLLAHDLQSDRSGFLTVVSGGEPTAGDGGCEVTASNGLAAPADDLPSPFGRYAIIRRLGQGGMGTVYLARDTGLDRLVALKIPREEYERSPDAIARFQREARAAAAFEHPNFCRIYDVGEIDGRHFIAMAYIEGRHLTELIDPGLPMEQERAAAWALRLALALGEAHRQGIVHRDLKPLNIMIDGKGEPIIMDFGLARRLEGDDPELTRSGLVMGSPHYMSPEQIDGNKDAIGPASDVYSLGVILYELLTGQRPFQGPGLRVLGLISFQDAAPLAAVRPEVDPELAFICQKAMAKKIDDRFASMTALAEALASWLAKHRLAMFESSGDGRAKPGLVGRNGNGAIDNSSFSPERARVPKERSHVEAVQLTSWMRALAVVVGVIVVAIIAQRLWIAANRHETSKSQIRRIPGSARSVASGSAGPPPATRAEYINSIGMELVRIDAGRFFMASPTVEIPEEEHAQHAVQITRPFLLGAKEVTWLQYHAVLTDESSIFQDDEPLPANNISWFDAIIFCNKLSKRENRPPYYRIGDSGDVTIDQIDGPGYRLPTAAQWEYAARAGSRSRYPFGDDVSLLGEYAWFLENSGREIHPVGKKRPNEWELYDMLGNVWEWCQDSFETAVDTDSSPGDAQGKAMRKRKLMRGGSVWDTDYVRPAARQGQPPDTRLYHLGFRVAVYEE